MTIIDFNPDGSYSIEALQAPEFTTLVKIEELPPRIKTKRAEIIRLDLATE